jgi:hypothetical protein
MQLRRTSTQHNDWTGIAQSQSCMMNFSPTTQGQLEVTHDMHVEGQFKQNFGLTLRLVTAF